MKQSILLLVLFVAVSSFAAEEETRATFARFVPERSDDFAFENDLIAFRAYGPALRAGSENSGFDCWLKRVKYPIVNKWYAENQKGKSYHKDHGEGLDNYKVGASAGTGGTGIWLNGQREALETYVRYEVLDVSPQRSRFKLMYERKIGDVLYAEEKTITIELGQRLFQVDSVFFKEGAPAANLPVCIGLTTHDGKAKDYADKGKGWIACWESLDDSALGTAVVADPAWVDGIKTVRGKKKDKSHIFLLGKTNAEGRIRYRAGYGWEKAGEITSWAEWEAYLNNRCNLNPKSE